MCRGAQTKLVKHRTYHAAGQTTQNELSGVDFLDLHQVLSHLAAFQRSPKFPRSSQTGWQQFNVVCLDLRTLANSPCTWLLSPPSQDHPISPRFPAEPSARMAANAFLSCLDLLDSHQLLSYLAAVTAAVRNDSNSTHSEGIRNDFGALPRRQ